MDDDIRDRFRGAREPSRTPERYSPAPPRRPQVPQKPLPPHPAKPAAPPAPAESWLEPTPTPARHASKKVKKRRKSTKWLLFFIVLVLLVIAAGGGYALYKKYLKKPAAAPAPAQANQTTPAPKPAGTIRFVATGDNLAFESINNAAKKPDGSYDYVPLMDGLKPFFDKSDIRLCNESTPAGGAGLGISSFPNFNAPTAWSIGFANLGCNVMNLGTDHTNDKGQPAIDAMLASWDAQKNILAVAGANRSAEEQSKIRYFTVKGVKFAFLSYTTRTNNAQASPFGINIYTDDLATKQVTEAHKNASMVVVSMNWGNENSGDISADQDHIALNLAANNADIILGVGPHVLQPAKVLSGTSGHQTLVWFSLGNFLNSQVPIENLIGGMAIMDIDVATQQISDPKILPFYMHYEWTAAQKKSQSQADLLARHNFKLYPLDQAADALARSQNGTTVEAQTARVTGIITKFVPIKVIKSTEF